LPINHLSDYSRRRGQLDGDFGQCTRRSLNRNVGFISNGFISSP
jgi:hypothetical protein